MAIKKTFFALLIAIAAAASHAQSTFTHCVTEGKTCTLSTSKLVRFGVSSPLPLGRWSSTLTRPSGSFFCSAVALSVPDPANGVVKVCEVMDLPPPPAPVPAPPASSPIAVTVTVQPYRASSQDYAAVSVIFGAILVAACLIWGAKQVLNLLRTSAEA